MRPARTDYEVVIIGGGVIGLYTAYHLSFLIDPSKILVVDRGFLSGGASGRNGGGVRQQWETRETIRLARESVRLYRRFARDFGYNPWFRQGGYLFLSYSEEENAVLRRMESAVRAEDIPVRWVEPAMAQAIVPELDITSVQGGTYLSTDGVIHPFPVLWGLHSYLKEHGVELLYRTEVVGVGTAGGAVKSVVAGDWTVATSRVVNAAGGWSSDVNRLAGLESASFPTLHEILATMPLRPFLTPMVVTLQKGVYFSQTMRGEVVGGMTLNHDGPSHASMGSSTAFLFAMSRELTRLIPLLSNVRILRSWAGYYDDTPDGLPVMGEDARLKGFIHANGFGGHGFMLAPSATSRIARMIAGEETDLKGWLVSPQRFLGRPREHRPEGLSVG